MYELMSLRLKCVECGRTLMDPETLIDNEPSIRMDVECCDQRGTIWLSSIYGSYNFKSDIGLPKGMVVGFYCPECKQEISSAAECISCGAPMVPFHLDMGGKVSICSRAGCKNHFVEFEDLSIALRKFYHEYGFPSGEQLEHRHEHEPQCLVADDKREIIESGTFLHSYCPHCRKSLIHDDLLRLRISSEEEGDLYLSPYLNVFSSKSTIFLPEDIIVSDLKCWHCDNSLIGHDRQCERCGSPVARISVTARTKLIDFYICTKKGCKWHGLKEEDLYDIRLEDSLEW